ncbi:DegT/DnrJ/EryC1/StrS family aminotransferase [Roseiconus lacunae]|uniref:Aminotransferase class I/II-fold pyridoxal phosphate-dependent enzyme n=1 Tax=Roseiconus lacunae TaxID=2605694 RepID=A0ABT7PDI7_9BACT|nr:aminotransferase class I/II-fold pyridoxal phosphate-dependent enzyme [Roseiconus lacunae]MDM4014570.1 aminotransferase class I/II-fold pyridoxal phosphate-dependent enzyme [Roseiconus lacunae]
MGQTPNRSTDRIYLSPPHMAAEARANLLRAFDSNWVAPVGPDLDAFEREFAESVGSQYAVAVSSGTAALHLALRLAGVGPGDFVPVSTLTFVAPANAIRYTGATPIFVDSEWESWNMDPAKLRQTLEFLRQTHRTAKAVVAVDAFGQCADYAPIRQVCEEYDVTLIEDAAESLGATYGDRNAGSLGDIGCFSFNGNKMITTSGGGMLVTDQQNWAEKARFWSTQARDPAPHYEHSETGHNYRLSNLLAAVGRGQLKALKSRVERRREIYAWYREHLGGLPGLQFIPEAAFGQSSCWLTCVLIDPELFGVTNEQVRLALEDQNIESRPCWKPMHWQPLFADCEATGGKVSEKIFERGLCLPSGSQMTPHDLQRVAQVIRSMASQTVVS